MKFNDVFLYLSVDCAEIREQNLDAFMASPLVTSVEHYTSHGNFIVASKQSNKLFTQTARELLDRNKDPQHSFSLLENYFPIGYQSLSPISRKTNVI